MLNLAFEDIVRYILVYVTTKTWMICVCADMAVPPDVTERNDGQLQLTVRQID